MLDREPIKRALMLFAIGEIEPRDLAYEIQDIMEKQEMEIRQSAIQDSLEDQYLDEPPEGDLL